jgi:hypothetical protein
MRWFWFCMVALLAVPALARSDDYSGDGREPHPHSHGQHHRGGALSRRIAQPGRQGLVPTGFWYRCDTPAGYYPYVPTCQVPWRIVPPVPFR